VPPVRLRAEGSAERVHLLQAPARARLVQAQGETLNGCFEVGDRIEKGGDAAIVLGEKTRDEAHWPSHRLAHDPFPQRFRIEPAGHGHATVPDRQRSRKGREGLWSLVKRAKQIDVPLHEGQRRRVELEKASIE